MEVLSTVQEYYGKVLSSTESLKTSACTSASRPHPLVREALKLVPKEVKDRYYGCGSAVPLGIGGLSVLDLGCGTGQDCFVAATLVGKGGKVIGIDMTDEQLAVANGAVGSFAQNVGYTPNVVFRKGFIEDLSGIEDGSIDLVISNCVVNLSPRKDLVLKEVFRVLREGGEFYFSDVYCDRRLSQEARQHKILWGECISGALYVNDFLRECHNAGFADPRKVETKPVEVNDYSLRQVVGNARFSSITFRLFKLPDLETKCEDYGQVAVYKGTIEGQKHSYVLDDHHVFESNKPALVCGNTASMLSSSWLKSHFHITGDRSTHFGEFACGTQAQQPLEQESPSCGEGKKSCC